MPPPNLVISKIGPESDVVLRNLSEHYRYDMSEWFELDTDADGRFSYDTAPVWEKGYDAYLARVGDLIAGFALVGSGGQWWAILAHMTCMSSLSCASFDATASAGGWLFFSGMNIRENG